MLRDFLYELFGLKFYGVGFERIFWPLLMVIGLRMLWRSWQEKKASGESPGLLIIGVGAVTFLAYNAFKIWTTTEAQAISDGVLFFNKPIILSLYGVAIASGFAVAIWLAVLEARRTGLSAIRVMDVSFWALVGGLVGSRLAFQLVDAEKYYNMCFDPPDGKAADCFAVFRFWEGGLVFYGGLIVATLSVLYYMHRHKLPMARYVDVLAPAVPIGQFFGRLGCVAAGCCHGKYCPPDMLVALKWPGPSHTADCAGASQCDIMDHKATAAFRALDPVNPTPDQVEMFTNGNFITAHPTQLYESGFMLLLAIFLIWFRSRKTFHGQVVLAYIMLYAIARSFIEVFRGDKLRGTGVLGIDYRNSTISELLGLPLEQPLMLSTSQMISIVMFSTAAVIWIFLYMRSKQKKSATNP